MEQNIWSRIKALEGKTLYTTKQRKPFKVVSVDQQMVVLSIGPRAKPDRITISDLEMALKVVPADVVLQYRDLRDTGIATFRQSYVVTIVNTICNEGGT